MSFVSLLIRLIRARRRGGLAPVVARMGGWLLDMSTLGVTLFLLGSGPGLSALAWVAPAVLAAAAVLCGWLLRSPLTRPLKIVSWVLLFDTLVVAAFMPFTVWIANEALRVSAYSSTNESAVRTALAKNPNDPAAHSSLGMIDNMRGDRAGAMAEWRQVLRVEPDNVDALLLLGAALARAGKVDEARPLRGAGRGQECSFLFVLAPRPPHLSFRFVPIGYWGGLPVQKRGF